MSPTQARARRGRMNGVRVVKTNLFVSVLRRKIRATPNDCLTHAQNLMIHDHRFPPNSTAFQHLEVFAVSLLSIAPRNRTTPLSSAIFGSEFHLFPPTGDYARSHSTLDAGVNDRAGAAVTRTESRSSRSTPATTTLSATRIAAPNDQFAGSWGGKTLRHACQQALVALFTVVHARLHLCTCVVTGATFTNKRIQLTLQSRRKMSHLSHGRRCCTSIHLVWKW